MKNKITPIVYEPREIKQGAGVGTWHFVEIKSGVPRPIGYCSLHAGHKTAAEAQDCFRKYLQENAAFYAEFKNGSPSPCLYPGCGKSTTGHAKAGVFGYQVNLCDAHRNGDGLKAALKPIETLTPLAAG